MKKGFIYITTNKINGLKYIGKKYYFDRNGKTTNWKTYLGSSKLLKEDIKRLGADNFEREIIDEAETAEELSMLEIHYIGMYSASESSDYYNISNGTSKFYTTKDGIERGLITRSKWSEEKRKRVSEKLKQRFVNMSPETRELRSKKISDAHKNNPAFKKMRSETQKKVRANMSEEEKHAHVEKTRKSVNNYYANWSDETRETHKLLRLAGLEKMWASNIRKRIEYEKNTFIRIQVLKTDEILVMTIEDAKNYLGCGRSILYSLKNGKYNKGKNIYKKWKILTD